MLTSIRKRYEIADDDGLRRMQDEPRPVSLDNEPTVTVSKPPDPAPAITRAARTAYMLGAKAQPSVPTTSVRKQVSEAVYCFVSEGY